MGIEFRLGRSDHKVVDDFLARQPEGVTGIWVEPHHVRIQPPPTPPILRPPSIKDLDAAADAWAERLARDEVGWRPARIPVDGVPTEFSVLGAASRWVATAHLDEIDLVLEAHRFPLDSVTLSRLTDLSAYGVGASC